MKLDQGKLLTAGQVRERYGLSAYTLTKWIHLRRIHPVRVKLAPGEIGSDLRFEPADIAAAIEVSSFDEPGSRQRDPSLG